MLLFPQSKTFMEVDNNGKDVNRLFWQYNSVTEIIETGRLSSVALEQSKKASMLGNIGKSIKELFEHIRVTNDPGKGERVDNKLFEQSKNWMEPVRTERLLIWFNLQSKYVSELGKVGRLVIKLLLQSKWESVLGNVGKNVNWFE